MLRDTHEFVQEVELTDGSRLRNRGTWAVQGDPVEEIVLTDWLPVADAFGKRANGPGRTNLVATVWDRSARVTITLNPDQGLNYVQSKNAHD
jgi:hypothetical protein